MGGHGATVLLSLKRTRFRIWEIENALFCGKPENPKFRSEFRNSERNLTIPCRNRKFRVEFENSRAELRNSDRNFHRHRYSKRFSAACWTARLLTAAAYWLWRFLRPCYGNTQITQEAIVDG